jgi:hypothetical protein
MGIDVTQFVRPVNNIILGGVQVRELFICELDCELSVSIPLFSWLVASRMAFRS